MGSPLNKNVSKGCSVEYIMEVSKTNWSLQSFFFLLYFQLWFQQQQLCFPSLSIFSASDVSISTTSAGIFSFSTSSLMMEQQGWAVVFDKLNNQVVTKGPTMKITVTTARVTYDKIFIRPMKFAKKLSQWFQYSADNKITWKYIRSFLSA